MIDGLERRLGRKTLAQLVEHLDNLLKSKAQLKQFLFKHGLAERFSSDQSKLSALQGVFHPIATTDDQEEVRKAREALEEITTDLYQEIKRQSELETEFGSTPEYESNDRVIYDKFQKSLRADGYDLHEGRVVPFLSPSIDVRHEEGILERRLTSLGFAEALKHLEQATDNSDYGNWEAANGQVRSFMESLCNSIAAKLCEGQGTPPSKGDARKLLEEQGFINKDESELLRTFFQVLHPSGAHAGTSSEDDCHRRRLMAIALSNYYLERL